jgi:enoyl-CoA hydratase
LVQWNDDPRVRSVLIEGAGDRGLCAGGDVRWLYESARAKNGQADSFFRAEYRMNARIAEYRKPVVALMDGIVMGGGIGISAHASHRVVTERSGLAMPEVGIGFFPDVGATYLLSTRSPGEIGTHIALSAAKLSAADAVMASLADYFIPAKRLADIPGLLRDCVSAGDITAAVAAISTDAPASALSEASGWINACYAGGDVEAILARLDGRTEEAAQKAAKEIRAMSPVALKQTLRTLRRAREIGALRPCLERELILADQFMSVPDFVEGVRAAVIDKDRKPRWAPPHLHDVTPELLDRYFPETSSVLPPVFGPLDRPTTEPQL